ncbi:hypothetical protein NDU88_002137 [Pleurodeles waltl]|uniref:Uncharacterized protein n=1 Tax=Pleurodeles waltl TaxID=8319 RepID=A0AAV7L2X2_PLEWA|nr:hypothetical protein NDU88_002137 [Pleurodeles waltl]
MRRPPRLHQNGNRGPETTTLSPGTNGGTPSVSAARKKKRKWRPPSSPQLRCELRTRRPLLPSPLIARPASRVLGRQRRPLAAGLAGMAERRKWAVHGGPSREKETLGGEASRRREAPVFTVLGPLVLAIALGTLAILVPNGVKLVSRGRSE